MPANSFELPRIKGISERKEREIEEPYTVNSIHNPDPRFKEADEHSNYGYFENRFLIGKDSPINGGAYYCTAECEVIVVDDVAYPEKLDSVYIDLQQRISERKEIQGGFKTGILTDVYETVLSRMPYNEMYVEDLEKNLAMRKVSLGMYIDDGGICRHQALLGSYLLERLAQEGYARGSVSVDRNVMITKVNDNVETGGHAWTRYVNNSGKIYIIDPAQHYIGSLEQSSDSQWEYRRLAEM